MSAARSSRGHPFHSRSSTTCVPPIRGSRIAASVSVLGHGLVGRLLAKGGVQS